MCSWEYPNKQGIGCNIISSDDAANYLSFLQELRADDTGKDIYISGAVSITPFVGADGTPMTDVSDFADVFDHIGMPSSLAQLSIIDATPSYHGI